MFPIPGTVGHRDGGWRLVGSWRFSRWRVPGPRRASSEGRSARSTARACCTAGAGKRRPPRRGWLLSAIVLPISGRLSGRVVLCTWRQTRTAVAPQRRPPPPEVTGGAPSRRRDVGLWAATPRATGPQSCGHRACRVWPCPPGGLSWRGHAPARREGPLAHSDRPAHTRGRAFDRHHEAGTRGGNGLEERCRSGCHGAVQQDVPLMVHDTDRQAPGMPVDAAGTWVLLGVEAPEVSSSCEWRFPSASIPWWYAEEEASIIINRVQATAYSLRFAVLRFGFQPRLTRGVRPYFQGVLTVIVDVARVEAFLATRFGGDVSDIVPLGAGVWSKAFAFRRAGRDYVVRFGAHQEDFAKDRLAARYAARISRSPASSRLARRSAATTPSPSACSAGISTTSTRPRCAPCCPRCSPPSTRCDAPTSRLRRATGAGAPTAPRPTPAGTPPSWTSPPIGRRTVRRLA